MIAISRRQARRLRGIFRRHLLGIIHSGAIPLLVLRIVGERPRAQYRYAALAVEFVAYVLDQPDGAATPPVSQR